MREFDMYAGEILRAIGIFSYTQTVGLAVVWIGIAVAMMRSMHSPQRWFALIPFAACYAVLFAGLTIIAYSPDWYSSEWGQPILRYATFVGGLFGWTFTFMFLHELWRCDKGGRHDAGDLE